MKMLKTGLLLALAWIVGLVAPLFEQARVCATHLAQFGIGRYRGSQTHTQLKVTGIRLFSAGDFMGGEGTEDILLSDPAGGSRLTASFGWAPPRLTKHHSPAKACRSI